MPITPRIDEMLTETVRLIVDAEKCDRDQMTFRPFEIYRGNTQIGSGDYTTCHTCRLVELGEIGFIEPEQRRGLGTRTLLRLRALLPGYHWILTPTKAGSAPFWHRMQRAYPDEYYDGRDPRGRRCRHII
ncbi:hypothetical protein [Sciscionella marina]|uniref:hypothetical protein n=1 Tax=Sciscionella marina TaxID=508770 RepID=UPI0012F623E3|nr:hypothetical protein [Sciscionella marina]